MFTGFPRPPPPPAPPPLSFFLSFFLFLSSPSLSIRLSLGLLILDLPAKSGPLYPIAFLLAVRPREIYARSNPSLVSKATAR